MPKCYIKSVNATASQENTDASENTTNSTNSSSKDELYVKRNVKFFNHKSHLKCLLGILKKKTGISMRVLDWFVTNYCKENNTIYPIDKQDKKPFNVYLDYRAQLKGYHKGAFDPFCRGDRILFYYKEDKYIITTIGQLNFCRWVIVNKIIDYINNHFDDIRAHMKDKNSSSENIGLKKIKLGKSKRKPRHELSMSATQTINKHEMKVILDFS
jgi:hypothetical protein